MSQAKVDRYKEQKKNRKQIMKREKIENTIRKCVVVAVAIVLVGWIGYSAYGSYTSNQPKQTAEVDYTALSDLWTNLENLAE